MERKIQLCSIGLCVAPYSKLATTDDIEVSIIDSYFTDEVYIAQKGMGVTSNGNPVSVASSMEVQSAIISYDTKHVWNAKFSAGSTRVLEAVHDARRTASNLLDICWVTAGNLDAMADL